MPNLRPSSTTTKRRALPFFLASLFLFASALASLCLGAAGLSLQKLWAALISGPDASAAARILWYARIPRTAACILAGAGLAVSGAVIQKVLNNSLASPSIIGINAGAGLAVAVCCALGVYAGWMVAGAAFAGALCATFLVVITARKSHASRTTVVLAGVAVTACLNAVTETIRTMVPDAALASQDFRVGGFHAVNQARLLPAGGLILLAIAAVCTLTNELELLSLGDDTAHSLGMRVAPTRNLLLTLAALLAGASVSFAGLLGFVGLIVPHIARKLIGGESSRLIPFCALAGAGFVTLCDLVSRLIFAPYELPTGILLSFLGGPFFVWLLIKKRGSHSSD